MNLRTLFSIVCLTASQLGNAQETLGLSSSMFDKTYQEIWLAPKEGWLYRPGNDTAWARNGIDLTGWRAIKPTELSVNDADQNGRLEGWFRINIKLDSSFNGIPLFMELGTWMASDLYIDGKYIASSGNTGINGKRYQENLWIAYIDPLFPVSLKAGQEYTLALHVVDYVSGFQYGQLKSQSNLAASTDLNVLININGPNSQPASIALMINLNAFQYACLAVCAILSMLFSFLLFQNRKEGILFSIVLLSVSLTLGLYCKTYVDRTFGLSFSSVSLYYYANNVFGGLCFAMALLFVSNILKRNFTIPLMIIFIAIILCSVFSYTFPQQPLTLVSVGLTAASIIFLVASSYSKLKGSQWAIIVGLCLTAIFVMLFFYNVKKYQGDVFPFPFFFFYLGGIYLSFPISLLAYVSMRFNEILAEMQNKAHQVVLLSEEKKEQAINQQKILQEEVKRQTAEIRTTLDNLKSTQAQLIQSEKLASLGELTAGIAHEIQNPLNFVNNFSELSVDLAQELQNALRHRGIEASSEEGEIVADLIQNQEKINNHGKRASSIVKSMLEHSRAGASVKELTDINQLADEYLKLAYHGFKAKNDSFDAVPKEIGIKTEFDPTLPKTEVIPQDIGRVLLNLINNALWAVKFIEKPLVVVKTEHNHNHLIINVIDNGIGMNDEVKTKIFQPFFTTKPTGQGSGLGLSLAYDIVTKGHGGTLEVISVDEGNPASLGKGAGSEFIITIPF